jgi:hypothetical protein
MQDRLTVLVEPHSACEVVLSLTILIITIAVVATGLLTGLLRTTGIVGRTQPTRAFQLRSALIFILAIIGFGLLWEVGYEGMWYRLQTKLDGTIIDRQDLPQSRQTHGPKTLYKIRRGDRSLGEYLALDHNDFSLPRTMPVGGSVVKRKWELSYTLNGQRVDDFPLPAYLALLAAGFLCLSGAVVLSVRGQKREASRAEG